MMPDYIFKEVNETQISDLMYATSMVIKDIGSEKAFKIADIADAMMDEIIAKSGSFGDFRSQFVCLTLVVMAIIAELIAKREQTMLKLEIERLESEL